MPQAAPAPNAAPRADFARMCKDFTSLGGKPFLGKEGVVEVQAWLKTCERVFGHMAVTDRQKVEIASSFLQGNAANWFDIMNAERGEDELT